MAEKYQQLMKLVVVGDSGTGKSSLLRRFVDDAFNQDQAQTIGVEFGAKIITVAGKRVKLQIWDTAGQERYKSVTRSYYRGATACLVVYDVMQHSSYGSVPRWLQDVRDLAGEDVVVMLIGNKVDLIKTKQRAVAHNEVSLYAQEHHLLHFETSAATGELVADAFLKVVKTALTNAPPDAPDAAGDAALPDDLDVAPSEWSCQC